MMRIISTNNQLAHSYVGVDTVAWKIAIVTTHKMSHIKVCLSFSVKRYAFSCISYLQTLVCHWITDTFKQFFFI